jgi:glycosyltransferase involved in cell wall biosynthesis/CDP-glycerol glycerophosphotransferase (TagB/SpsB family)
MPTSLISVVVPTYNVAPYLPAFLTSLDEQVGGLGRVEVIFSNDGSTDESPDLIKAWLARNPTVNARMVSKPNGGLSSARNAGLEVATGTWVTFSDPDDVLTPTYLKVMRAYVSSPKVATVHLVVGKFVFLDDETGELSDAHRLRYRFSDHHRVADLERHPDFFHVAANSALYRRALLNRYGLRFDERVYPVWEDGHLTGRYLAKFDRPRIAYLEDAVYLYRRRADNSSLMQGAWGKRGKYVDVPRGWLDMLRTIHGERGVVPLWAQNMVLYDVFGYFRKELGTPSATAGIPEEWKESFLEILGEVLQYIDAESVEGYRATRVPPDIKRTVLLGLKRPAGRPVEVFVDHRDRRRLVRLRYFYTGAQPREEFRARGFVVRPVHAKIRAARFFGHDLVYERTAWLPANGAVSLSLDGRPAPLQVGPVELKRYVVGPTALTARLGEQAPVVDPDLTAKQRLRRKAGAYRRTARALRGRYGDVAAARTGVEDAATRALAKSPYARARYAKAWLLMDRDNLAQDNAEHLYRYLRAEQPHINAWFVLAEDSRDWARLKAEGFRLLAHRSREHVLALLNCEHLISSQLDRYVTNPLDKDRFGEGAWQYTFLQHGVTQNDLSAWFNSKPIELLLTVTPDEHASIVANGNTYAVSDREVKLTGFPRHDRLLELARRTPRAEEPWILVMPTWRRELLRDPVAGGNRRGLLEGFWTSQYAQAWRSVLESERLQKVAAANGWRIAFVPHPNMADYLDAAPLPPHVTVRKFQDVDVQEVIVQGGLMVTDYSSLAFEAAYIERPIVYFQFDQDTYVNGPFAWRRGYWDYTEHGFGPVTTEAEAAVDAIAGIVNNGGVAEPVYAARMKETFPFRDGLCSRRAYQAIRDLTRPLSYDELYLRLEPEEVLAGRPVEDPGAVES